MSVPRDLVDANPGVGDWAILVGYRGSVAHGTYLPSDDPDSIDDKDLMGLCVPPLETYFGLDTFGSRGTQEIKRDEWDIVVYEARKGIDLLAKGNPNILSLLWLPENLYTLRSPAGNLLLANRGLFVGRHVFYPFVGYARAQLQKMECGTYRGYMGEKRRRLVEKHGYDTKNATHLIRLLRMGIEFLRDGELRVQRHDAAELIEIRRGGWSLNRVKREADRLFALAEEAHVRSDLPKAPSREAVSALCVDVVRTALGDRAR